MGNSEQAISSRFGWVTAGKKAGPHPVADLDLADFPEAAVLPSLGALSPNWLLVVPRIVCSSLSNLEVGARRKVFYRARQTADVIKTASAKDVIIFEHGASIFGTPTGCGVEQAHLHAVALGSEFLDYVRAQSSELSWRRASLDDPWASLGQGGDYLMMMSFCEAWVADVATPTSQFLRRHAATYLDMRDEWDYREHPQNFNVALIGAQFAKAFVRLDVG